MIDKTKSSAKDDANKDTPKPQETAAPEQVKAEAPANAPAQVDAKDDAALAPTEAGKDTIDPGTGDETISEEENGDVDAANLDTVRINELINQIENAGGQSSMDLVHRLIQEEGLKPVDSDGGPEMAEMAGVRCRARKSPGATLQNWCNAARRALLKAA